MADVTVPPPPPLARVNGVELIHTGTWPISTGVWTATTADLQGAVAALDCPAIRRPGIKIGHQDGRFTDPAQDGDPLLGYVDNLTVTDDGLTLVGDFAGMPAWLAAPSGDGSVLSSAYPDRSIEGVHDFVCQIGHTHPFVLTAVALLGVTAPGVGTLQSLQDIAALYGVAASAPGNGVQIRATVHATSPETQAAAGGRSPMPNPRPTQVAAGVTTEDVRRQYYDDAPWSYWIVEFHINPLQMIVVDDNTGKRFRVPVEVTGEDTFTFGEPVEVLTRYIDADTSEPVTAAAGTQRLVYASRAESRPGQAPKAAETQPPPEPLPAPGPPVVDDPTPPTAPPVDPEPPAAEPEPTTEPKEEDPVSDLSEFRSRLGLPDDADEPTILAALDARLQPTEPTPDPTPEPAPTPTPQPEPVAASNPFADELQRVSEELAQIRAREAATAKAAVLDGAVKAGKIRPADKTDWSARYDKAPEVITDVLASIAAGTAVPVTPSGEATDPDTTDLDTEFRQFAHVFPPEPAATSKEN